MSQPPKPKGPANKQNIGGRLSIHNIEVDVPEWEYIQKTVTRKSEHANKTPGTNSKIKSALAKFADKLATPPELSTPNGLLLITNRQDLRFLQEIVKNDHAVLLTKVIPGYAERVDRSLGAARDRYGEYQKRAEQQANMLATLINKVEKGLNR